MAERTLRSYDPFAYHVNNVSELDSEVVLAYKKKDTGALKNILSTEGTDYDVFICINHSYHAFVLCAANKVEDNPLGLLPEMSQDPYDIPDLLLVHQFELCFESEEMRTYKIRKVADFSKDVKKRVYRAYHIGNYKNVPIKAFQLAALAASPTRFSVLLEDCVEFAKEFCIRLLSYCNNGKTLENDVETRIRKATATGLSAEILSRRIRSSATTMNWFLGGADVTTFLGMRRQRLCLFILFIILFMFLLIYPIFVAFIVKRYT